MLKKYSKNVVCILFDFINQYVYIFTYDALKSAWFYFIKSLDFDHGYLENLHQNLHYSFNKWHKISQV